MGLEIDVRRTIKESMIALNIFISSHRFSEKLSFVYRSVLPFLVILLLSLLIITYVPQLSHNGGAAQAVRISMQ